MGTIWWRPEVNALTTPQSYWIRFVPKGTVGTMELARRMSEAMPNHSEEEIRAFLATRRQVIRDCLLDGEQVTEEGFVTYTLSFTGRLNEAEDPLPPLEDCLQGRAYFSLPFINDLRHNGQPERRPQVEKLPLISSVRDSLLELKDVLNPEGALHLSGDNLGFDRDPDTGACIIEGTESGQAVQTRLLLVEESEIMLLPDIPAQAHPWNNEYRIMVSTHYTEHGTERTGVYKHFLRTPLAVPGLGSPSPPETGILTGSAAVPYVGINGGSLTADERLRIQVIQDLQGNRLLFSLLDLQEGGMVGPEREVTENGELILPGFAGSAVNDLELTVNDYAGLWELVRSNYSGRLVDVLDVTLA